MTDPSDASHGMHDGGAEHASEYKKAFWETANANFREPWYRLQKAAGIVTRLTGERRPCTLLDVGCGPGTLMKLLPSNVEYFGIDIATHAEPNIIETDIIHEPIAFDGKRFDLVTALGLFEYVADSQSQKFADIADLLNRDGKFVLTYTNFGHRRKWIYEAFSNIQPLDSFTKDLQRYFTIERSFPASHNWKPGQPRRRLVKAANMKFNVNVPVLSPKLAVDYFFICSPRS